MLANPSAPTAPIEKPGRKTKASDVLINMLKYGLLILLAFSFVLPFIWMVSSALKDDPQVYTIPPVWVPNPAFWDNFPKAWTQYDFTRFTFNSVFLYGLPVTVGVVLSSSFIAYGFSRLKWPGRDILFGIVLATLMIPYAVTMVPLFITWKNLGLINTYGPLVIPAFFGSAFGIFLLRQFYLTIPQELSDAARIDGANELGIWWRVILPLAKPALTVVALFTFIGTWNDYLAPLIYINKTELFPVALGVNLLRIAVGATGTSANIYPYLMAVSTIVIIPVIILFYFAQRTFIEGVTTTGLKG
jgi:ABC-type glycerol-3-phosphate transport system permease component